MHSSTIAPSMPARRTASATTSAPSSGAVNGLSAPRNFPVGVRTALTMMASRDRKSTRLNSSHANISYAVFCLKKKKKIQEQTMDDDERAGIHVEIFSTEHNHGA